MMWWPNKAHAMRKPYQSSTHTDATFSSPERANCASAQSAWEANPIMVLLGLCEHAAAKSSITTHIYPHIPPPPPKHMNACMHLMLEKTNRISGTGPEQIWQTAMHNSNHRMWGGNGDIIWSRNASPMPGSHRVSARWCNCWHLLT
jgi:hypothetical protein